MTDAELIRYIDGELDERSRADLEARVAAVPAAAERLRVLRDRSARLGPLLRAADPSAAEMQASARAIRDSVMTSTATRRPSVLLRAAVLAAVVIGAAMLVEPVRAWVLERARAVAEAVGLVEAAPGAPTDVTPEATPAWSFSVPWEQPVLELDAGSARGTLVVRRSAADGVRLESTDATTTDVLITPGGLRLAGGTETPAVYTLTVGPSISELRLRSAGAVRTIPLEPQMAEVTVPLR